MANGAALGMKLRKNPETGIGPAVKSVDPGGQAEKTGMVHQDDLITHINGEDVTTRPMKEVGALIKAADVVKFTLESSRQNNVPTSVGATVTLSKAGGRALGIKLMKNPKTGRGVAVKSVDAGGQADTVGGILAGAVISHINGVDVRELPIKEIGEIIKSSETVQVTIDPESTGAATDTNNKENSHVSKSNSVVLSTAGGQTLGFKLVKNPQTGAGAAVKSLDIGGQAEATGKIEAGMVITHINGQDISAMTMKEIGPIIKSSDQVTLVLERGLAPVEAAVFLNTASDLPGTVTLDTAGGKTLGVKLKKNPATGTGVAVKSVDVGGQAEASGKIKPEMVITHVNGTDVTTMAMKDIAPIIKSSNTVKFVLLDAPAAPALEQTKQDLPGTVTLDTAGGKTLGVKLKKNPATGTGVAVKSVDVGGQAEASGKIKPEMVITHVNGTDVTTMAMKDIAPLFKSSTTVKLVLADAPAALDLDPIKQAAIKPDRPGTVSLDTAGGKMLGIKLKKNPATGSGAAVKSVDAGGQAEATGKIRAEMVITHVNGTDITKMEMKDIGPIIKSSTTVKFVLAEAPVMPPVVEAVGFVADLPGTVTLDTSSGKSLGVKLMKDPATGTGASIKSVDAGGQAEATGKIKAEMVITHVNGTDVTSMAMKDIAPIIKSSAMVKLVLKDAPPTPAPASEPARTAMLPLASSPANEKARPSLGSKGDMAGNFNNTESDALVNPGFVSKLEALQKSMTLLEQRNTEVASLGTRVEQLESTLRTSKESEEVLRQKVASLEQEKSSTSATAGTNAIPDDIENRIKNLEKTVVAASDSSLIGTESETKSQIAEFNASVRRLETLAATDKKDAAAIKSKVIELEKLVQSKPQDKAESERRGSVTAGGGSVQIAGLEAKLLALEGAFKDLRESQTTTATDSARSTIEQASPSRGGGGGVAVAVLRTRLAEMESTLNELENVSDRERKKTLTFGTKIAKIEKAMSEQNELPPSSGGEASKASGPSDSQMAALEAKVATIEISLQTGGGNTTADTGPPVADTAGIMDSVSLIEATVRELKRSSESAALSVSKISELELRVAAIENRPARESAPDLRTIQTQLSQTTTRLDRVDRDLLRLDQSVEATSGAAATSASAPSAIVKSAPLSYLAQQPTRAHVAKAVIDPLMKSSIIAYFDAVEKAGSFAPPPQVADFLKPSMLRQRLKSDRIAVLLNAAGVLHRMDPSRPADGDAVVEETVAAMDSDPSGRVTLAAFFEAALGGKQQHTAVVGRSWDDPQNTASSMGTMGMPGIFGRAMPARANIAAQPQAATNASAATVARRERSPANRSSRGSGSHEAFKVKSQLLEAYKSAEKSGGQPGSGYLPPERLFSNVEMNYMINEAEMEAAIGGLDTFDAAKGAPQSVGQIFSRLRLNGDGKIAVRQFVSFCDPLLMVQAARAQQTQTNASSSSDLMLTAAQLPSGLRSKFKRLFEGATKKGNACLITNVATDQFDAAELKISLPTEAFSDYVRELTNYDAIVTPSEGALDIDLIFQKLDFKSIGYVTIKQFVDMVLTTAKSAKSEKKGSKKRFNTWGRKKKRSSIDQAFGITTGDVPGDGTATTVDAYHSKRAVFGGDVLF
jgi:hypothetical protein